MGEEHSGSSAADDALSDSSFDQLGVLTDASDVSAPAISPSLFQIPTADLLSDGRSSFSSYVSADSFLTQISDSDSEAAIHSRCTSLTPSVLPPEVEEIGRTPPWCASPVVSQASTTPATDSSRYAVQRWKSQKQWLLELQGKRDQLNKLIESAIGSLPVPYFYLAHLQPNKLRVSLILKDASALMSKIRTGSIFFHIFRAKVVSPLDKAIQDFSWLTHLFEQTKHESDHNENGQLVPPFAINEPSSFLIWSHLAKVYHASPNNKLREAKALIFLTCNNKLFSENKLLPYERVLHPLLAILQCDAEARLFHATFHDLRFRDSTADGRYNKALNDLCKLLHSRHAMAQAISAYAISELTTNIPPIPKEFVENDLIPVLVEYLTGFNKSRIPLEQKEPDHIPGIKKETELVDIETHVHANAIVAGVLWKLCKQSPSYMRRIIEPKLLSNCLTKLSDLENESPESRRVSVKLLMEIANLFSDEDDGLRQFFTAVYLKDAKGICQNLRSIANEGSQGDDYSNIVPCIIAFTCLSKAFNTRRYSDMVYFYEGWEIVGTLIHILEMRYPGIVGEETVVMLSQNIPVRSLILDPDIQAPELVILCCIAKYVVAFEEPESMLDICTLLEWASEERYLTRDATIKRLMLEAKSKLDKI